MICRLKNGELVQVEGGCCGTTVCCLSGDLWLTRGDGIDYFVSVGRPVRLAAGEKALVEAFGGDAELTLKHQERSGGRFLDVVLGKNAPLTGIGRLVGLRG